MSKRTDTIRRIATAMAIVDGLQYVIQMPARKRVKNPNFKSHVEARMKDATKFYVSAQAMRGRD